jgi:hypothetical protein
MSTLGSIGVAEDVSPTKNIATAAFTDGDATSKQLQRILVGNPELKTANVQVTSAQTDLNILLAAVAGTESIEVVALDVLCSYVNSVNVDVCIGFGSANTPTPGTSPVADIIYNRKAIPPGGGDRKGHGGAIIGKGATGAELRMTSSAATSGHLSVTVAYYIITGL